jgi:hypothetical protein
MAKKQTTQAPATLENAFGMATPKATPAKGKSKAAPAQAAPAATPKAETVALRGGPAVQSVRLTGKAYRTAAKHNADWWATITSKATLETPATVAALLEAKVPAHFVGYAMRRGYLQAV